MTIPSLRSIVCSLSLLSLLPAAHAVEITDFGSNTFTLEMDPGFTTFTTNQDATGLGISGIGGDTFGGFTNTGDIGEMMDFYLTASIAATSPIFVFQISIYSADLQAYVMYGAESFLFGEGLTRVQLSFLSSYGSPFTEVGALMFYSSNTETPVEMRLEKLEAVPEPSVFLLGAAATGMAVFLRRRRNG